MSAPVAAITGASSGIGAEFARQLAARGCALILIARREDRMRELAAKLNVSCTILAVDLATDEGIRRACEALEDCPKLEYLVNNAGFGTKGFFHQVDRAGQDRMMRLHVLAPMHLTRSALPGMVARRAGAVINVASVAGFLQSAGSASYCSTKAWMNVFTEGLYLEMQAADSPVRVQALCPGYTYSEFHDVVGMDRGRVPKSLWLSADRVVRESLAALERNQLFVIPDWRYRWTVAMSQWTPRWLKHTLGVRAGKRLGRV